jgi:hypothetical protein
MPTNDRAVVLLGVGVWAVLLVVALLTRSRLQAEGRGWWVWTPVAAIVLGLYGLRYIRHRDERRAAAPDPAAPTPVRRPVRPARRAVTPAPPRGHSRRPSGRRRGGMGE